MQSEIAKIVGVDREIFSGFFENKGDLTQMSEAERSIFMGVVLEIAGLLEVPDDATELEWDAAGSLYREMRQLGEITFGEGIWELIDLYYAIRDPEDPDVGRDFLRANPSASQALDWQNVMIQNTPLLAAYYTSDEKIRQFYKQQMYQTAEKLFGNDLWEKFDIYGQLKESGNGTAAKAFWDDNPQLELYMEFRDETLPSIDEHVNHFGKLLPDAKEAKFREDEEPTDIVPQSYQADERDQRINNTLKAYSNAYTDFSGERTDIREAIREQADDLWPGTRNQSNHYYDLIENKKMSEAIEYVKSRPELEARVSWEYDKIQRFDLVQAGAFYKAAGREGFDEPAAQTQLEGPLGRLQSDSGGIPPHLALAYGVSAPGGGPYLTPEQEAQVRSSNFQEKAQKLVERLERALRGRFTENERAGIVEAAEKLGLVLIHHENSDSWELRSR